MSTQGLDDPLSTPAQGMQPSMAIAPSAERAAVPHIELTAVDSLDAIIRTLYASLYPAAHRYDAPGDGAPPGAPGWARFRALFDPSARLVKVADGTTSAMTVDEFIAKVEASPGRAVAERELARRTDAYAGIAQVFSSYDRVGPQGEVCRGINTIQLRNDGRRWWITSLMWADEQADEPMPSRYLRRH